MRGTGRAYSGVAALRGYRVAPRAKPCWASRATPRCSLRAPDWPVFGLRELPKINPGRLCLHLGRVRNSVAARLQT